MNPINFAKGISSIIIRNLRNRYIVNNQLITPPHCNKHGRICFRQKVKAISNQLAFFVKWHEKDRFYWLYDFLNKTKEEQAAYLPYPEFRRKRNLINLSPKEFVSGTEKFNYITMLRDKFVFGQLLKSLSFPTPEITHYIDGGHGVVKDLARNEEYDIAAITRYDVDGFCKISIGECGKGVFRLTINQGKIFLDDKESSIDDLRCCVKLGYFIVQKRLAQHSKINQLYPLSVNTLRIVTCLNKHRQSQLLSSCFRIGAHGNHVDNWFMGGLVVGINDNGTLKTVGTYEFPIDGRLTETKHPDTRIVFEGFQVPYYKEAVSMVLKLHSFFPFVGAIGWDVAITNNGPQIIEGNDNWEISLMQVAEGKGLKEKWYSILG